MSPLDDDRLMARAQAGDSAAFAGLYDRHSPRAFRFALDICGDDEAAERAVEDAFVSVWHKRRSYRTDSRAFAAWLLIVVLSRASELAGDADLRVPA